MSTFDESDYMHEVRQFVPPDGYETKLIKTFDSKREAVDYILNNRGYYELTWHLRGSSPEEKARKQAKIKKGEL
jgi:hypothetical protein